MRVLALRHHEEDSPGLVGEALAARGATVDTCQFPDEGLLPDPAGYDRLVILGSSWSVNDPKGWIAEEVDWLRRADVPVLGICFGAQLLSVAFGGSVERSPVFELGWVTVDPVQHPPAGDSNGEARPPVVGRGPWFQFHGDRCILPPTARLLASNDVCAQAFTVGRHLGVQFHPELDVAQLARWFEHGGREEAIAEGKDPGALLAETSSEEPAARRRAKELVDTFLAHAATAEDPRH